MKKFEKPIDKQKSLCYNNIRRKGTAQAADLKRWCGSMAEQLICNQQVDGSTPFTSSNIYGSVPEWPKGADCKSVVCDFGGPNPPAPTKNPFVERQTDFLHDSASEYVWKG